VQAMMEAVQHLDNDTVNGVARSVFAFIAWYGDEAGALQDAEENPNKYYWPPGPTRPSSITACVPAFVQESGDAIDGGLSARAGGEMTTGGHLDGSGIDMDTVVQPGEDLQDDESPPPPGSIRCAIMDNLSLYL
jgi:hypothetical protein